MDTAIPGDIDEADQPPVMISAEMSKAARQDRVKSGASAPSQAVGQGGEFFEARGKGRCGCLALGCFRLWRWEARVPA